MSGSTDLAQSLSVMLRALKLPGIAAQYQEVAAQAETQGWSFTQFLHHLCELELAERKHRRIERNLKHSELPEGKTLATLDLKRLPAKVRRMLPGLCEGHFADQAENVLAFGLPGRGKTHVCSAIGHELVQRGYKVLFIPAYRLVQRLLVAKRDLLLDKEMRRLDVFDAVIVDDIGYVQQDRAEMEVLFTFLAERYERRSVVITSNLVFSQWDRIFKDPMTTAAAIDRIVHHSTILEMTGPSIRDEDAKARNGTDAKTTNARKEEDPSAE
jgi:DNA replication protein DnaC